MSEQEGQLALAKQVLDKIRGRWPVAEQVRGGAGNIPTVATLILPQAEWHALVRDEQVSLTYYTEQMIKRVRLDPESYLTIPKSAPAYPSMLANYRRIRDEFWEIVVGRIKDEDEMSLMVDSSVVRGDVFWDHEEEKFGFKASQFRAVD